MKKSSVEQTELFSFIADMIAEDIFTIGMNLNVERQVSKSVLKRQRQRKNAMKKDICFCTKMCRKKNFFKVFC